MENFWHSSDTIPPGFGFSHFDAFHLSWLGLFLIVLVTNVILYRKLGQTGRERWRKIVGALLVADEMFMVIPLLITGRYTAAYLPLHLCSINIWVSAVHSRKPSKLLGNFLYTVGIPGALAALLFPTWTKLPLANYMLWHSFTVHILLVMYPAVQTMAGDIRPEGKLIPKTLALLGVFAAAACVVNLLFDTNFMFLRYARAGNPLYIFQEAWGSHLYGFPVLGAAVIIVMYVPMGIIRKFRQKNSK